MRIIDKNTDFYDFYQNIYKDDTTVFDRRDSYDLSKEEFMRSFRVDVRWISTKYRSKSVYDFTSFLVMHICNTFWLMALTVAKWDKNYGDCRDYDLELLAKWNDYDVPRVKFDLSVIQPNYHFLGFRYDFRDAKTIDAFKLAIHTNDYKVHERFDRFTISTLIVAMTKSMLKRL